jgi:hypothetical protein
MSLACFNIQARSDPQTLLRLLNFFGQLGLVPTHVRSEETGGFMSICIEQRDLHGDQASIISEKMRSSFLVLSVNLCLDENNLGN